MITINQFLYDKPSYPLHLHVCDITEVINIGKHPYFPEVKSIVMHFGCGDPNWKAWIYSTDTAEVINQRIKAEKNNENHHDS